MNTTVEANPSRALYDFLSPEYKPIEQARAVELVTEYRACADERRKKDIEQELIEAYYPTVFKTALLYLPLLDIPDLDDLMQEGAIATWEAIKKYDTTRTYPLEQFVWRNTVVAIRRYTNHVAPRINRPAEYEKLLKPFSRVYESLSVHGEIPSVEQLAWAMEEQEGKTITRETARGLLWSQAVFVPLTKDIPLDEDGEQARILQELLFQQEVMPRLGKLLPNHLQLLIRRYRDGATLEEAGRPLGLTRDRVRQINKKNLIRLRYSLLRQWPFSEKMK